MMKWPEIPKAPARYFTTISPPSCSCPDWHFRGRYRPCKHVKALREAEALVTAQNAKNATAGVGNCQQAKTSSID